MVFYNSVAMRRNCPLTTVSSILLCCAVSAGGERIGETFFSLTTADVGALRGGSYRQAIGELRKKESDPDSAARFFKLAFAYVKSGDTGKALSHYGLVANADEALSPLAWEAIGDIVAHEKRADSALACYGRALVAGLPSAYRTIVFEKIRLVLGEDTAKLVSMPFRAEYVQWWTAQLPRPENPFVGRIDSLVRAAQWRLVDSCIDSSFDALDGGVRCAIVKSIDRGRPPDSGVRTENLFLLAGTALDCRQLDAAERLLDAARNRKDFGAKITDKTLQRMLGRLYFLQRKYREAIGTLSKFNATYRPEPDLVLLVARAYHSLDMLDKSAVWYDRFITLAPRSPKLPEFLWRRAWIEDKRNRPVSARRFYRKIYTSYPRSQWAEESWIRYALSFLRVERYDSALASLASFEVKYGASQSTPAARFWRAKCCLLLNNYSKAKSLFDTVARGEPYNYYAHRARDYLALLGDSSAGRMSLDTSFDSERTMRWLDSIAPVKKAISVRDSLNLRRGFILTAIGSADAALFLESVEHSYPENLSLAFKIAMLYRFANVTYRAALTGRRFSWRIPSENRAVIALPIYTLMYPLFFKETIAAEAKRWNVDPNFVYAVIRQESVFNPVIVSPAGAIGLMQIMPATGKAIAQELNEPFSVDSLRNPSVSIRYGTYYLRQLLDEFNENEVLALASYNGGPPRAKEWYVRNKEKDFDLFVEDIDFSETRNYIKKVLANFWVYRHLSRIEAYIAVQ